jgi:hypothetical protein
MDGLLWSQPQLKGYDGRIPDFMWISRNSDIIRPVLIEIEAPGKPLYTKDGFRAEFHQARGQISDWMRWFEDPSNTAAFRKYYGLVERAWIHHAFRPEFILIYGRRGNAHDEINNAGRRAIEARPNETVMSFDRLAVDRNILSVPCLKGTWSKPRIHAVPMNWGTGPYLLSGDRIILRADGAEQAIDQMWGVSDDRKAYLKDRFSFWHKTAAEHHRDEIRAYRPGLRE